MILSDFWGLGAQITCEISDFDCLSVFDDFFALIHLVCHRYTLYVIKIFLKISSQNISSCECGGGGSFQMEQLCQLSLFIVSAPPFLSEMKNVSTRPF